MIFVEVEDTINDLIKKTEAYGDNLPVSVRYSVGDLKKLSEDKGYLTDEFKVLLRKIKRQMEDRKKGEELPEDIMDLICELTI